MNEFRIIRWQDPPEGRDILRTRPSPYTPAIEELQARAGEWGVIAEKPSVVTAVQTARILRNIEGLEVVTSKTTIFARWKNGA